MQTYLTSNSELRIETNESVIENLKRKGWVETPQPLYDINTETCEWQNGQWAVVTIVPLSYTAEEWIQQQGFTSLQIQALTRLEANILNSGKTLGPIMTGVKAWLEGIMFQSALNPQPRDNWPLAPASYVQASQEAAQTLSS